MARETDAAVTTTRTIENHVDSEADESDLAIELSGSWYGYIGQDSEGYYHHMDKRTRTVFVTANDRERFHPDGAGVYWFRVTGPVVQTVCLDNYEDKDIRDWKQFVAEERGWDELPTCIVDRLQQELKAEAGSRRLLRSP